MNKKLEEKEIKEIARINFRKALLDYDYEVLSKKIEENKMYTVIEIYPGERDVAVIVYEAGLTDADPSTDYGKITVDPYTGECKRVEVLNLKKRE